MVKLKSFYKKEKLKNPYIYMQSYFPYLNLFFPNRFLSVLNKASIYFAINPTRQSTGVDPFDSRKCFHSVGCGFTNTI